MVDSFFDRTATDEFMHQDIVPLSDAERGLLPDSLQQDSTSGRSEPRERPRSGSSAAAGLDGDDEEWRTGTGFEQPSYLSSNTSTCRSLSLAPTALRTAYTVEADASVESVKLMIENKEFVPADLIRLVSGGEDLEGGSLTGNGVEDEDTLTMLLDVNGGMRKKWKKKRMRRLRRKRRKMRQRAR